MALTAETLARHELRGLRVRVAAAHNRSLVGIEGPVVSETEQTLSVTTDDEGESSEKQVPKAGATFEFALAGETVAPADIGSVDPADATDGADAVYVTIDGERLVARPARRTERSSDSTWS